MIMYLCTTDGCTTTDKPTVEGLMAQGLHKDDAEYIVEFCKRRQAEDGE